MVAPVGLLTVILLVVVVGFVVSMFFRKGGGDPAASKPQAASGVTLNCPHCGKETEASRPQCANCGEDL